MKEIFRRIKTVRFGTMLLIFILARGGIWLLYDKINFFKHINVYSLFFVIQFILEILYYYFLGIWLAYFIDIKKVMINEYFARKRNILKVLLFIGILPIIYYFAIFFFSYFVDWAKNMAPIILISGGMAVELRKRILREYMNVEKRK